METKNLNTKYCVGLGEILFDVLPSGSQLGGAPANFCLPRRSAWFAFCSSQCCGQGCPRYSLRLLDEKNRSM